MADEFVKASPCEVRVGEAIHVTSDMTEEEIEQKMSDVQAAFDPECALWQDSDDPDIVIQKALDGAKLLQERGYDLRAASLDAGVASLASMEEMVLNGIKRMGANTWIRFSFRVIQAPGIYATYYIEVREELSEQGGSVIRARRVGAVHTAGTIAVSVLTTEIIFALIGINPATAPLLMVVAIVGAAGIAASVIYNNVFRDKVAEEVRARHDESIRRNIRRWNEWSADMAAAGGADAEGIQVASGDGMQAFQMLANKLRRRKQSAASAAPSAPPSQPIDFPTAAHPHRYQRAAGLDPAQLVRHELRQQRSTLDIDQILSDAVAKNADTLIDRLLAKNPNLFQKTLGRSLVSSVERFAREIRKSKTRSVEEAFDTVFSGKSGAAFAANIGQQAANALVSHGIHEIFYRERTRTHRSETQRSQDTANQFRLSQSQKAADLIKTMKQGQRNV